MPALLIWCLIWAMKQGCILGNYTQKTSPVDNFSTGDAFTMGKFKVEFEKVEFIFKYEF